MGELLANFKGYDVQAMRKEVREEAWEEAIDKTVQIMKKLMASQETAIAQLVEKFGFSEGDAARKVEKNWQTE